MEVDILTRFILIFSSLFVIVEPFGAIPSFVGLTKNESQAEIKKTALRATLFGGSILMFFALFGIWLFKFLGIELNSFRVAGGLLLGFTAVKMLLGKNQRCRCTPDEMAASLEREDVSLVPIAIPLLAGPGAITSVMVFATDYAGSFVLNFAVLLSAIALTFTISYFVLRSSSLLKDLLGKSGITVVERLMGLLLASLSVQMVSDGVQAIMRQ